MTVYLRNMNSDSNVPLKRYLYPARFEQIKNLTLFRNIRTGFLNVFEKSLLDCIRLIQILFAPVKSIKTIPVPFVNLNTQYV